MYYNKLSLLNPPSRLFQLSSHSPSHIPLFLSLSFLGSSSSSIAMPALTRKMQIWVIAVLLVLTTLVEMIVKEGLKSPTGNTKPRAARSWGLTRTTAAATRAMDSSAASDDDGYVKAFGLAIIAR